MSGKRKKAKAAPKAKAANPVADDTRGDDAIPGPLADLLAATQDIAQATRAEKKQREEERVAESQQRMYHLEASSLYLIADLRVQRRQVRVQPESIISWASACTARHGVHPR